MWLTCCVLADRRLWTHGPFRMCLQHVSFISVHVPGRLSLCALFGARHSMNACLLHNRLFGALVHHMWLTCCVLADRRLWTTGPSRMCLQHVSFISVHVRGRLMLCALFWARLSMNACLLHGRLFGAMLQNMWLTCCVFLGVGCGPMVFFLYACSK